MPAFSTCWNSHKHTNGGEMIQEILDLGFDTVELSHGMNASLLNGVLNKFEKDKVKVCGLHNFCPSPVEVMIDDPDCYEFTHHRNEVRERAFHHTVKTIEFARRFNAKYVVLHLGSVPIRGRTKSLENMAIAGKLNSRSYVRQKIAMIKARERIATPYLQRARNIILRLADHAANHQIQLAIESRSHFEQLPTEREMLTLMEEFQEHPFIGYWHDFGHVQRKHNLSILDHTQWLDKIKSHLIGTHVHDVIYPHRDHRVPMTGDMRLDQLLPFIPESLPHVWEISPSRKANDIRSALVAWRKLFPTR